MDGLIQIGRGDTYPVMVVIGHFRFFILFGISSPIESFEIVNNASTFDCGWFSDRFNVGHYFLARSSRYTIFLLKAAIKLG